jgi:hypothetical protein
MGYAFPPLLRRHLDHAGMLPIDFARRIGKSPAYVYCILGGTLRTTGDDAELCRWAAVLGLSGAIADAFVLTALLDRCPERVRAEFTRLHRTEKHRKRSS